MNVGSMATVDQYVEEIISLCGDSLDGVAGPLQLLRCVWMTLCPLCVCVGSCLATKVL